MKKYVSKMNLGNILKRLKEGDTIHIEFEDCSWYFIREGFLCKKTDDGILVNVCLDTSDSRLYFINQESFEITKPGVYKTRNGLKAYISFVDGNDAIGVIENYSCLENWEINGIHYDRNNAGLDIVSKWEE